MSDLDIPKNSKFMLSQKITPSGLAIESLYLGMGLIGAVH